MSQKTIAELNDAFRSGTSNVPGHYVMTNGVSALPEATQQAIIAQVKAFEGFTEDNDPYGEHDFGSFHHEGTKFFWKIDYYDPTLTMHSEDSADPEKTIRVLTIMLASEY